MGPTVDVRRSADRRTSVTAGVHTAHSFSGGGHYDAANTSFGPLVLHDEHRLAPSAGFAAHRHRGVEVVTWVLDGLLRHEDGVGEATLVRPGQVQRLTAGSGAVHAELNARTDAPVRFVQAWLLCGDASPAGYDVGDVAGLSAGGLVAVASGAHDAPVRLCVDATLHVARPSAGGSFRLPAAARAHVFVAAGSVDVDGVGGLDTGDAVRLVAEPGRRLRAVTAAEVLAWTLP